MALRFLVIAAAIILLAAIAICSLAPSRVFAPLADPEVFARVHIGDRGQIAWSEEMEICPDAAYLEVAGQAAGEPVHA